MAEDKMSDDSISPHAEECSKEAFKVNMPLFYFFFLLFPFHVRVFERSDVM